jgi:two-component sensor histidine kinase
MNDDMPPTRSREAPVAASSKTSESKSQPQPNGKHPNGAAVADNGLFADEIIRRIERLGDLHRRLSCSDDATDLAKYLRNIAQSAVASVDLLNRTHLKFEIAEDCIVPGRRASLVGLAVNELVMNAIKYAHPSGISGQLLIGCSRRGDAIVVDVADDGVGLPEGFDPMTEGGFGLKLVRSLADQLKAQLDFADTGIGLHARLTIPARIGDRL